MPEKRAPPASSTIADELPHKESFKIGEVARIVGVETYVLRFWESEFKRDIRPERTRSNQRLYRRRDVETFLEIKRLRYDEKLELQGARRKLRHGDPVPQTAELPFATASATVTPAGLPDAPATRGPAGLPVALPAGLTDAQVARMRDGLEELIRTLDEDEKNE